MGAFRPLAPVPRSPRTPRFHGIHGAHGAHGAPNTAPAIATTPTLADLGLLYGGRGRLLTVAEVAEQLGVCDATVYRLCEGGELRHLRVVHSIRVRPEDLDAFVYERASTRT